MTFKLDEEILRKALLLDLEERMDALPKEYELPHVFSKKFNRKMRKLEQRAKRAPAWDHFIQISKRAAIVFLAVAVTSFTATMSIEALRMKFFQFVEKKYKAYSDIFYESIAPNGLGSVDTRVFVPATPTLIPAGFELVNNDRQFHVLLYYAGPNGTYIQYRQTWIDKTTLRINTEGTQLEPCDFDGQEAFYYTNIGNHTLLWDDGTYAYFVASNTDKETVFEVARSVKPEK